MQQEAFEDAVERMRVEVNDLRGIVRKQGEELKVQHRMIEQLQRARELSVATSGSCSSC